MTNHRIFLYVAPRANHAEPSEVNHVYLNAVRGLIAEKGLTIAEEFFSQDPDDTLFDAVVDRVTQGEASAILKLNPAYLMDLPRIASLLDAHMEVEDRTGSFDPWEVGHFLLSGRRVVENGGKRTAFTVEVYPTAVGEAKKAA